MGCSKQCLALLGLFLALAQEGSEDDESNTCWSFHGTHLINRRGCCQNIPCGLAQCFSPPEFTYSFCCNVPACRPLVIGETRRALLEVFKKLPQLQDLSQVADHANLIAGEHLASLHESFGWMRLERRDDGLFFRDCDCAVAIAVMALLRAEGTAAEMIAPTWFTHELDWRNLLAASWSPIFLLFAFVQIQEAFSPLELASVRNASVWLGEVSILADLRAFMAAAQGHAKSIAMEVEARGLGFRDFTLAMRHAGLSQLISARVHADLSNRSLGRRCSAVPDRFEADGVPAGRWVECQAWSYSPDANFSSPLAALLETPKAVTAACVVGAPRTVVQTYGSLRRFLVEPLKADTFVYVPYQDIFTHEMEESLRMLGPVVTAIAEPDVDAEGMRARFTSELDNPKLLDLYRYTHGPFRSPLHGQMGSVMWSYFLQHICRRMVKVHEEDRGGSLYQWVVLARADMMWVRWHPPIHVLDPNFVHVPFGQDNSFYDGGSEPGLNDRHAAIPRSFADDYLGRWESLTNGYSWAYLKRAVEKDEAINAEQFLLMHLRALEVPVARFPPVAFVAMCIESPQCLHLYRGTDLSKKGWTFSAKYYPELVEVVRTTYDEFHRIGRWGWIWHPTKLYQIAPGVDKPWELHSLEWSCCLNPSGSSTCKWWDFLMQCRCTKS